MAIEIVSLPSYNMVIFHSDVNVYQRVDAQQQIRTIDNSFYGKKTSFNYLPP